MGVGLSFSDVLKSVIEDRGISPCGSLSGKLMNALKCSGGSWSGGVKVTPVIKPLVRKAFVLVMEIQTSHDFPSDASKTVSIKPLHDLVSRKH
jgi:hypothetical protein